MVFELCRFVEVARAAEELLGFDLFRFGCDAKQIGYKLIMCATMLLCIQSV